LLDNVTAPRFGVALSWPLVGIKKGHIAGQGDA